MQNSEFLKVFIKKENCWHNPNSTRISSFVYIWGLKYFFTGLFAIRSERDYVLDEDFMKAVRKIAENKKLETKLDYKPV